MTSIAEVDVVVLEALERDQDGDSNWGRPPEIVLACKSSLIPVSGEKCQLCGQELPHLYKIDIHSGTVFEVKGTLGEWIEAVKTTIREQGVCYLSHLPLHMR